MQTSQLMLYREIIAVCSQIHTKHINTLCGQDIEILGVKPGGTYSDHRFWQWTFRNSACCPHAPLLYFMWYSQQTLDMFAK